MAKIVLSPKLDASLVIRKQNYAKIEANAGTARNTKKFTLTKSMALKMTWSTYGLQHALLEDVK